MPPRFGTRTLDFLRDDPPELVALVNKNGDNFLCTMTSQPFPGIQAETSSITLRRSR